MEDIITNFKLKNTRMIRVRPCCANIQGKPYGLHREQCVLARSLWGCLVALAIHLTPQGSPVGAILLNMAVFGAVLAYIFAVCFIVLRLRLPRIACYAGYACHRLAFEEETAVAHRQEHMEPAARLAGNGI